MMKSQRIAIMVSKFNPKVTEGLLQGALAELEENGILMDHCEVFHAPGAFELPLLAQRAARSGRFDGVICLGCVIKGDTAHFEFISLGTAVGLQQAALATDIPVTFGVLTTYNDEQAEARSGRNSENKGREAAAACLGAIETLKQIPVRAE